MLHSLNLRSVRSAAASAIALAAFLSLATPSFAQSPTDLLRSLAPGSASSIGKGERTRSVPVYTYKDGRAERAEAMIDYAYRVDLTLYFAYNSSEIHDRARFELRRLGEALQNPALRPYRYLIAGHTDAAGSFEYNEALSLRRANAVRWYLIRAFGIEPWRLVTAGFGQRQLKAPHQPYDGINRRVEVALVADPSYAPGAVSGPGYGPRPLPPPGYGPGPERGPGYAPPPGYAPTPGYGAPPPVKGYIPPGPGYGTPRDSARTEPCTVPTDPRPRPGKDDDFGRRPGDCPSGGDSVIINTK